MYERILVPTDGSTEAGDAVEHAIHLARTHDAELHALYVVQTNIGPEGNLGQITQHLEEAGEKATREIERRATEAGVGTVRTAVRHGTPHRSILEYAEEAEIDLVVMGTHGRTGIDRYLLGSVTEKVVRLSEAPVLTVRMTEA